MARDAAGAVEFGDLAKVEVTFGIKAEVAGEEDLGAEGSENDGGFEKVGVIALHGPKVVFPTEEIEHGLETLGVISELRTVTFPIPFQNERAAHRLLIADLPGKVVLDLLPVGSELRGATQVVFIFVILLLHLEIILVSTGMDEAFGFANEFRIAERELVETAATVPGVFGWDEETGEDYRRRVSFFC